jgi:hypothetical protein
MGTASVRRTADPGLPRRLALGSHESGYRGRRFQTGVLAALAQDAERLGELPPPLDRELD